MRDDRDAVALLADARERIAALERLVLFHQRVTAPLRWAYTWADTLRDTWRTLRS